MFARLVKWPENANWVYCSGMLLVYTFCKIGPNMSKPIIHVCQSSYNQRLHRPIPLGFIPVPKGTASLRGPFSCHQMITKHMGETFRIVGLNLSTGPTTTTHRPENQRCRNTSISSPRALHLPPGFPTSSHDGTQTISPFIRTFTENTGLGLQKLGWGVMLRYKFRGIS